MALKVNVKLIEKSFTIILKEGLGLDLTDPNLADTPNRIARFYQEFFDYKEHKPYTLFPSPTVKVDQMVALGPIQFASICSHHFLPFMGSAHVAYLPNGQVVGVSKIARLVQKVAHAPQIQEQMAAQILDQLTEMSSSVDVAIVIDASHTCMTIRGIEARASIMRVSDVRGKFRTNTTVRAEFFNLIGGIR